MTSSGYIDWHRLQRTHAASADLHTYVFAYWLADGDISPSRDAGLAILKPHGHHPDWFLHAASADENVYAVIDETVQVASHTVYDVFPHGRRVAKPLLAAVLLGTARFAFADWSCERDDLTRSGTRLVQKLDQLYLRPSVIVTFGQVPTDGTAGSRDQADPATVS